MTRDELLEKIEKRIGYLLDHCDSDEETEIVKWVASHLASEFGVTELELPNQTFVQAA